MENDLNSLNEIKVILYDKNYEDNNIVNSFLNIDSKEYIKFKDNSELQVILNSLKKRNIASKECLILAPFKGRHIQTCPKSPEVICCNYQLINTGFNCIFNCSYCYLQSYLNTFGILQFTNMDEVFNGLKEHLKTLDKNKIYRIGTGNYTDSLMLDQYTNISESLISMTSGARNIMLEIKTKSDNINHLIDIEKKGNTVLAWSLNTEENIKLYEEGTATLENRIKAAQKAVHAGYFVAFHFDPIIIYDRWEEDYKRLLKFLFESIDSQKIVWISLGGFRFSPGFGEILKENFPLEKMTSEEMFPGIDGKYRYFIKKREYIYNFFNNEIKSYTGIPFVYLCMETKDMWYRIFKKEYNCCEDLENEFSDYLKNKFLT